jgi:long-chain acyl-CoA synthetase
MVYDENAKTLNHTGIGEIYIGGDSLFNGYFRAPKANRQCIYYDNNGERYLKSGDIMQIEEDGYVTFLSRKKRMIKVSGYAIFPSEIEQTASNVSGIKKSSAIGVGDERTGHKIILFYETGNDSKTNKIDFIALNELYMEHKSDLKVFV